MDNGTFRLVPNDYELEQPGAEPGENAAIGDEDAAIEEEEVSEEVFNGLLFCRITYD